MKNDNCIVFILEILQQPVNVKVSDDDVLKVREFLRYLRVVMTNRKWDVVTMLEERFGINQRQKTTLQVIAIDRGIKRGFASSLICGLIKEIRNKYRDFFETFYNGKSDWGFFYKMGDMPSRNVPLNRLALPRRMYNWHHQLMTVDDLLAVRGGEKALLRLKNVGKKSALELRTMMRRCNLQFDEDIASDKLSSKSREGVTETMIPNVVTAKEVNDVRQKQFDATVEHVSELLSEGINKELEELFDTAYSNTNVIRHISIESLIPEQYEVPKGLIDWKELANSSQVGNENAVILTENIISSLRGVFNDWDIAYNNPSQYRFKDGSFKFDSKFDARVREERVVSVDEFAKAWEEALDEMIKFFVDAIVDKISNKKGMQALSKMIIKDINYPQPLSLIAEDQRRVYEKICNSFTEGGWQITFRKHEVSFGTKKSIQYQKTDLVSAQDTYSIDIEPKQ